MVRDLRVREVGACLDAVIESLTSSWIRRIFGYGNAHLDIAMSLKSLIELDYPNLYDTDVVEIDIQRGSSETPIGVPFHTLENVMNSAPDFAVAKPWDDKRYKKGGR
jgi:hypothetical protein